MLLPDVYTPEEKEHLLSIQFPELLVILGPGEVVPFKPFLPKAEAVSIPVEYLHDAASLTAEEKVAAVERSCRSQLLYERG